MQAGPRQGTQQVRGWAVRLGAEPCWTAGEAGAPERLEGQSVGVEAAGQQRAVGHPGQVQPVPRCGTGPVPQIPYL